MIVVNQKAPEFKLFNSEKQEVTLSQFQGQNVLLLFFPFAFTGTCTKELCSVRDEISWYDKSNAVVLGISIDSPFTLQRYKEEQGLNMQLLSDFNREACTAYDSKYEVFGGMQLKGVAKRSAFVVDKEGMVRYAEVLENAGEIPNFDAIKKCLEGLN
ncbi:MAG: redoxin domain-containing protein [Bacteroidetes bacterium]|nr:redoxin domain-containing protein [Bacteroidota bacterium]